MNLMSCLLLVREFRAETAEMVVECENVSEESLEEPSVLIFFISKAHAWRCFLNFRHLVNFN